MKRHSLRRNLESLIKITHIHGVWGAKPQTSSLDFKFSVLVIMCQNLICKFENHSCKLPVNQTSYSYCVCYHLFQTAFFLIHISFFLKDGGFVTFPIWIRFLHISKSFLVHYLIWYFLCIYEVDRISFIFLSHLHIRNECFGYFQRMDMKVTPLWVLQWIKFRRYVSESMVLTFLVEVSVKETNLLSPLFPGQLIRYVLKRLSSESRAVLCSVWQGPIGRVEDCQYGTDLSQCWVGAARS